jgi:uncharacterized protein YndB with AHSA1/START domain
LLAPVNINTDAPVITRDEILIHAPIEAVWKVQTDVARWPSWQPEVDATQADEPLTVGSVFRWHTAGLDITSTVAELDAPHRIVWSGPAQGIVAVHEWTLTEQGAGCSCGRPSHGRVSQWTCEPACCRGRSTARSGSGWRT